MNNVRKATVKLVDEMDVFGLRPNPRPVLHVAAKEWAFQTAPGQVESFNRWLQEQIDNNLLTLDATGHPWTDGYVYSGYKSGALHAYTEAHKDALAEKLDWYEGTREQFLKDAFNAPVTIEKLKLIGTRTYEQLKGITTEMSQRMNRILADGLAHGRAPAVIARRLSEDITNLSRVRAARIARTEIIHAHAEGQLDTFEKIGIKELDLMAELSTAGDELVCAQCEAVESSGPYTVEQAHGMVPVHPNCRCAWTTTTAKAKPKTEQPSPAVPASAKPKLSKDAITNPNRYSPRELEWGKRLDNITEKAFGDWVEVSDYYIKEYARTGRISSTPDFYMEGISLRQATIRAKAFIQAMKEAPKYEGVVYRGLSIERRLKVGDIWKQEYAHATTDLKLGKYYVRTNSYEPDFNVLFEYHGAKSVRVGPIWQRTSTVTMEGENEAILTRQNFIVKSITKVNDSQADGGYYYKIVLEEKK
jgi:SPP1 gp7 family putative phage head morphogenesis protein